MMDNGFCWDNCVSTYTLYLGWVYYVHLINSVRYVKKLNLSWNIKLIDIPLNFLRWAWFSAWFSVPYIQGMCRVQMSIWYHLLHSNKFLTPIVVSPQFVGSNWVAKDPKHVLCGFLHFQRSLTCGSLITCTWENLDHSRNQCSFHW